MWAIEFPEATYHTIVALAPDPIIYSSTDKEFLYEFPAEGTDAAKQLVTEWEKLFM